MDIEIYKKLDCRLPHHTLVNIKDIKILKEYILLGVEWLLENTSDNIFILIDGFNKSFWKNYIDNDKSMRKRIVLIEFNETFIEECCDNNFIKNTLFTNNKYETFTWFFISKIDDKYKDVIRRYLMGGRRYRLNLICLDYKTGSEMHYMFMHHISVTKEKIKESKYMQEENETFFQIDDSLELIVKNQNQELCDNIKSEDDQILNLFLENREIIKRKWLNLECYIAIDKVFLHIIPEETYNVITEISINIYLQGGHIISSLSSISQFLAKGLKNEKLDLDDIKNISTNTLLLAIYENDYDFFKKSFDLY